MDREYAAGLAGQALDRSYGEASEARPLQELETFADELGKMNAGLREYLVRFNGPEPAMLESGAKEPAHPPSCYRRQIARLEQTIRETGVLVDQINRLG